MATSCPRCAATVSEPEGLCRHCGWSVPYLVRPRAKSDRKISYAERYRGTIYESHAAVEVMPEGGLARGRTFVVVGLAAVATLFSLILVAQPG
jgi:hypothetical protein